MGKHKCACGRGFCQEDGGEASVRMPTKDDAKWQKYADCLWGPNHGRHRMADQRISVAHFPPGSLKGDAESMSPDGSSVGVRVVEGALPSQTDADMYRARKGAIGRALKSEALVQRHETALLANNKKLVDMRLEVAGLRMEVSMLRSKLKEMAAEKEESEDGARVVTGIGHQILQGKSERQARALVGVSSHDSLVVSDTTPALVVDA